MIEKFPYKVIYLSTFMTFVFLLSKKQRVFYFISDVITLSLREKKIKGL